MAHHLKTMLRIVNISGATSRFGLCKCVVSVNEDVNLCINCSISKIANKTLVYRITFHSQHNSHSNYLGLGKPQTMPDNFLHRQN